MSFGGQLRRYVIEFAAVVGLVLIAAPIAIYIVSNQRLRWPWEDTIVIKAEFASAQSAAPGQGQAVTIAGVKVGEISKVSLDEGHAVVEMTLEPGELGGPVYSNATAYLRPRTGLNDMAVQLDPGKPGAGVEELEEGEHIPGSDTISNVNPDEVLSAVDADSRRYLSIVMNAGSEGFKNNGARLREVLKAQQPALERTRSVTKGIADRRRQLRRLISNLRLASEATAAKDDELAGLIEASADVFGAIGEREAELTAAIAKAPETLRSTRDALRESRLLAGELGPASQALRPLARELGPALLAARPLLRDATPIVRDDLRPLVRETQPLLRDLRPSVTYLNRATPDLVQTGRDLNYVVNELGFNPPGKEEGYLFWTSWFFHNAASLLSTEDSHGVAWRGLVMVGCSSLGPLTQQIPILAPLANLPAC